MAQHPHSDENRGDQSDRGRPERVDENQSWRWCPRCGRELVNHRCKLVCPRCHYFMSCSDFD